MGFLQDFEQKLAADCHQFELPFCTASCPFGLDIKGMMEKWKKGRFKSAFRAYQNAVGFPLIVNALCTRPCEGACIRCGRDGAVSLGRLEKLTIDSARNRKPNAYNMPMKSTRVAIVGAGLSGLGCALRLCNRKYQVTIFEKEPVAGGHGRTLMDPVLFDEEIQTQFMYEEPEWKLNTRVTTLALSEAVRSTGENLTEDQKLSCQKIAVTYEAQGISVTEDFDAVYLAVGSKEEFPELSWKDQETYATVLDGVFAGGRSMGVDDMKALAHGLEVSLAVERFLKTGNTNEPRVNRDTRICMKPEELTEMRPVEPEVGDSYTQEEGQKEAERCVLCSCDSCMKECDLMRLFQKTPRRIYEEVYITIHPGTLSRDGTWATRLITTCDQCGLCKSVCPQRIDMGQFFLQSHNAMKAKGAMPWAFHDYWLRDMAHANQEAHLCRKPEGVEHCTYAFFPGCQLGASDPDYVIRSYEWLRERYPDTGILMNCCGAPAKWAGDPELHEKELDSILMYWAELGEPTMILACPTCKKMFDEHLPEIPTKFLLEVMAEAGEVWEAPEDAPTYSIFDPCASRSYPDLQNSVRKLTEQMKLTCEPLSHEGEHARCCSYGGNISIAAPLYSREVARNRLAENDNPYITYCVNCRDTFASQSKPVVHILDLLLGLHGTDRIPPTITRRRDNRLTAVEELRRRFWQEEPVARKEAPVKLVVTQEMERKLSKEQILVSDMEEVVAYCEERGRYILNEETGERIGHKKIQNMTFWAVYVPGEEGYILRGGYAHRMNLEGE